MIATVVPLIFAASGILAMLSMAATWHRYRHIVAANVAALRTVEADRSFSVRIASFCRDPGFAGHPALRRAPRRLIRRPIEAAPALREAA